MHGFINLDKPLGITSHDAVAQLRRTLKRAGVPAKVGHAGTLDPLATGVLILCVGSATRLSEYVMAERKVYEAIIQLGSATSTYDAEGEVTFQADASAIQAEQVLAVLPRFTGTIDQLPPAYSAIKQGGKKLYELARQGVEVTLTPRRVTLESLSLSAWEQTYQRFHLRVVCSAGTYIRSLAHDIGQALGVGAHLAGLRRMSSGAFDVSRSHQMEQLQTLDAIQSALIAPAQALADWQSLVLTAEQVADVRQGRMIQHELAASTSEPEVLALGVDAQGDLVALLRAEAGQWKPHKVFQLSSET